jgi:hypothetical protein
MNVFNLTNVSMTEAIKKLIKDKPLEDLKLQNKLEEVITQCAISNPRWDFIATRHSGYGSGFCSFEVRMNEEVLGKITQEWSRGDHAVGISNDRIKEKRARGQSYVTTDPKKALLQIKKTFAPLNASEKLKKARELSDKTIRSLISDKQYEHRRFRDNVYSVVNEWAMKEGFQLFLNYVAEHNATLHVKVSEDAKQRDLLQNEFETMEGIKEGIKTGESILLVKEGNNYIVQKQAEANIYNDYNLPEAYKAKFGMLKLVDPKVFLSNVGCRIDETTFIISVKEIENENTI